MYQQSDRKSAVKEIQKFLYALSDKKYENLPRVAITGIYNAETANAVKEFQRTKGLNPTGITNLETFTLLYEDYFESAREFYTDDYILGDGRFPFKEGDQNEDVRALHLMINELSKTYSNIENVGTGAYYSKKTAAAVEELRKLFLLPSSRAIDKKLYTRIKQELNAVNLSKEK